MDMKKFFEVNVSKFGVNKNFYVYRPASLNNPKDNAVMFITLEYMQDVSAFFNCQNCLVYWPESKAIPDDLKERHMILTCLDPRKEYCRFFVDNHITYYPRPERFRTIEGALVAEKAQIGEGCTIMPGAYIGGEVVLGKNVYIGSGVRLVGEVVVGNNVIIRENTVIGADGLSNDRDETGRALTMPQFGSVKIEDDVQIGALTVIARGAIDSTLIKRGVKIDNSSFISHNVQVGEDTFVVGESIMFGSSSVGSRSYISGNATIRDGCHVGDCAVVGMGAVVTKEVGDRKVVKGNPAR